MNLNVQTKFVSTLGPSYTIDNLDTTFEQDTFVKSFKGTGMKCRVLV
jgi:hypothetical protein